MDNLWLALIGVVAGLTGGLLGIGGSIVMIPGLNVLFGHQQHVHQAAAMIVNFFVVAPAAYQHLRARAINWAVVRAMAPMGVIAVVAGVELSKLSVFEGANQVYLTGLFGVFMAGVGVVELVRLRRGTQTAEAARTVAGPAWKAALLVGLPAGLVAGLLGVGGGIVMVPLQRRVLRLPLRVAIANSATAIVLLSPVGALRKNYAVIADGLCDPWWTALLLAAVLIPTAMCAGFIGGKLTHTLPVDRVRWAFILLLFVFAAKMCWGAASAM